MLQETFGIDGITPDPTATFNAARLNVYRDKKIAKHPTQLQHSMLQEEGMLIDNLKTAT